MDAADNASMTDANLGPQLDVHHILQHGPAVEQRKASASSSASSSDAAMRRKWESSSTNRPKAYSASSRNTQTTTSTREENRAANRAVRTLPCKIVLLSNHEQLN